MLNGNEMKTIFDECVSKKEPSIKSPEALEFRKELDGELAFVEKNGGVFEYPADLPDME